MQSHVLPQQVLCDTASIMYELDLGQHTLLVLSDGSSEVLARDVHASSLTSIGVHLDTDETYHLFIALYEQFHQSFFSPSQSQAGEGQR